MDVAVIGTGNVATHLVLAMRRLPTIKVVCICGTSMENTRKLKASPDTLYTDDLQAVPTVDVLILATPDDKIKKVSMELLDNEKVHKAIICHTSGSVSSEELSHHRRYGCFYPLQTFTKGRRLSFRKIPICITASDVNTKSVLWGLGELLSKDVRSISDRQRAQIHLSAVLVNNMVNHIIYLASERLTALGIEADILQPLIAETVKKSVALSPLEAQTGPARRGDSHTIQKQVVALAEETELKKIYETITESIVKTYHQT